MHVAARDAEINFQKLIATVCDLGLFIAQKHDLGVFIAQKHLSSAMMRAMFNSIEWQLTTEWTMPWKSSG